MAREMLESKTPDDEKNGKDDETTELDGFAANSINKGNCDPITRNSTCNNKDGVTGSQVVQLVVDGWSTSESDSGKHSGGVQSETVEGNIKEKPRSSCTEKNLTVGPFAVKSEEIRNAGLGSNKGISLLESLCVCDLVDISTGLSGNVSGGI